PALAKRKRSDDPGGNHEAGGLVVSDPRSRSAPPRCAADASLHPEAGACRASRAPSPAPSGAQGAWEVVEELRDRAAACAHAGSDQPDRIDLPGLSPEADRPPGGPGALSGGAPALDRS